MSLLFLSPAILASLTALSIPVLLHLRPHTKVRRLPFAAMRFLRPALKRSSRRLRIQNLLLLLVRLAVFTFVILALARPVIRKKGGAVGDSEGATDVVVILDATLSMACKEGPKSRFDRSLERADEMLDSLQENDGAGLIVMGRGPRILAELSPDIGMAREGLSQAAQTSSAGAMLRAVSLALRMLEESEAPNRELCVFSDLQQSSWTGEVPELASPEFKDAVNVYAVDIGSADTRNLAIAKTEIPSDIRQTGVPATLSAEVWNFGDSDSDCLVRLAIDGKFRGEKAINVPSGGSARAQFRHSFDEEGLHHGFFRIGADPLEADDSRFFAINVHGGIAVLCVDGDPSDVAFQSETYFLGSALAPGGGESSNSPFLPKIVTTEILSQVDVAQYAAIILANVARLDAHQVSRIDAYVNAGGRLLMFPGGRTDRDWHNGALAANPGEGILPAHFGDLAEPPPGTGEARSLKDYDIHHPIFLRFRDNTYGDLSTFRFEKVHTLKHEEFAESRVLARFSDGLPALIEANRGLGKVVLAAFPADSEWGNLPLKTAYLPFVHELTRFLTGRAQMQRGHTVGDRIPFTLDLADFGTSITIAPPQGDEQKLKAVLRGNLAVAHFTQTDDPGIYRVSLSGTEREKTSQFAVNIDTRESDLSKASEQMIRMALQGARVSFVPETKSMASYLQKERSGVRLSLPFLYLAFALYLIESFLSGKFAPRQRDIRREEDRVADAAGTSVRVQEEPTGGVGGGPTAS